MIKTNRMDEVLKELGELYELNREIQRFSFVPVEKRRVGAGNERMRVSFRATQETIPEECIL